MSVCGEKQLIYIYSVIIFLDEATLTFQPHQNTMVFL